MATHERRNSAWLTRRLRLSTWAPIALAGFLSLGAPQTAQGQGYGNGSNGVFPPLPDGVPIPTWNYLVWNIRTGGVRYCSSYTLGTGLDTCNPGSNPDQFAQIQGPQGQETNFVYQFSTFEVNAPPGSTHYVVPVQGSPDTPLTIMSQGDITLTGGQGYFSILWVRGADGQLVQGNAVNLGVVGGKGGPGAFDGGHSGSGGTTPGNGNAGFGPVGGSGGIASPVTVVADFYGAPAQASPVNPSLTPIVGGSGGGGGAGVAASHPLGCGSNISGYAGGGGGGGGGALLLAANRVMITNYGAIYAQGGNGGYNPSTGCQLQGGGGAGGSVRIVATEFTGTGEINLSGGIRPVSGERAAGGFARFEVSYNTYAGPTTGSLNGSAISFPTAPIPLNQPTLHITSVAGATAPDLPLARLDNPDIALGSAVTGDVQVQINSTNVPINTTVTIKVVPASGTPQTFTSNPLGGSLAAGSAMATVQLPPGAGIITATATFNISQLAALFPTATLPMVDGQKPDRVEVMAMADGTSRAFFVAPSGARLEFNQAIR